MRNGTIVVKIGNMRKQQEFTVCPRPTNVGPDYNQITIQSDKRIAQFDLTTGKGYLSKQCQNGAYNVHLHPLAGATEIVVPSEIIEQAKAQQFRRGDVIGGIVTIL